MAFGDSVAFQVSVPPSVLVMLRTALRVAVVPTFAESVTDAGLTASTGWYTVSVTGMMKGLPFAPVALIVSCAVYVPAGLAPGADLRAYAWGFSRGSIPFAAASADDWVLLLGRKLYVTADAGRTWSLTRRT